MPIDQSVAESGCCSWNGEDATTTNEHDGTIDAGHDADAASSDGVWRWNGSMNEGHG